MFKLSGVNLGVVILLAFLVENGYGYCNKTRVRNINVCMFNVECQGTIRDVDLTFECAYPNKPPSVRLLLKNATERFDEPLKATHFLQSVTDLRAIGNWRDTALSVLQHTPIVRNLYLSHNKIRHVPDRPFYKLDNLIKLDMSHNWLINIEGFFKFEKKQSKLRSLLLFNNQILILTKHTFEQLGSLVELDLSHNLLRNVSDRPFRNLSELSILRINYNRIDKLEDALNDLTNLKHLYLKGNRIMFLEDGLIKVVQHLQTFELSYNDIDKVLPAIFVRNNENISFHGTCKIILSNNNIKSLPNATESEKATYSKTIFINPKSKVSMELDFSNNDIDEIAYNAFEGINKIISLDLSHNQLYEFNVRPQDLSNIERLNLSNNCLTILLHKTFLSMEHLEKLDISSNALEVIDNNTFASTSKLKYVNMANNKITSLSASELQIQMFHPEGGTLIMANNSISKMFIGIGEAHRLRALSLSSNDISNMCEIKLYFLMDLRRLDLSKNAIEVLSENCMLLPSGLIFLDLSQNKIITIHPSAFSRLGQLQTLTLSHNKLEKLSFGIFEGLKNLINLDLSYNRISFLASAAFYDLKSLNLLSVRYNRIERIDEREWIDHNHTLIIYIDGSNLTCEWLYRAIDNFEKGFSNVQPTVLTRNILAENIMESMPCRAEDDDFDSQYLQILLAEERMLLTNRKILNEIMHLKNRLDNILKN